MHAYDLGVKQRIVSIGYTANIKCVGMHMHMHMPLWDSTSVHVCGGRTGGRVHSV